MKFAKFLPLFALAFALNSQATQTHQYQLNGNLTDDLGGVSLISHGGTFDPSGYSFGRNQGLTLNNDLGAVYTVDLEFRFDVHGGWQKIIDFSDLISDAGMYTLGANYYAYPSHPSGAAPADGVNGRLTLTRDISNLVSIYSNGVILTSFVDSGNLANFTGHFANFFIDDFATSQGEAASGYVNFIRTYNTALDARDVANLGDPSNPIPEPFSVALMGLGFAAMMLSARRRG